MKFNHTEIIDWLIREKEMIKVGKTKCLNFLTLIFSKIVNLRAFKIPKAQNTPRF